MSAPTDSSRAQLRLRSIAWALGAGLSALVLGLPFGVEAALRAGGCGFFYGLLAFHLQRVDPDDSHLQAGLVGAVCGIHSLALPPLSPWPLPSPWMQNLALVAPTVMMELVRAWLPLIGAALVLHGSQVLPRLVAARTTTIRQP
ncbi:hypothetical protein KUL97_11860 [Synechococcus sp. HK05]|uniref:hypothetical protein n=1 Tax=Synechococcus sp. HK05 TaxID=2725975 RepID=UPI001C394847|nr:hypothetical protein [Synechococcus sp. HK05]MBV2352402.1 hypothetical protein [Synechococcus sp. HK05]